MAQLTFDLPDTVVATGTGSGLGEECAAQLLSLGVGVIGIDVNPANERLTGVAGYRHVEGSVSEQSTWDAALVELDGSGWSSESTLGFLGAAAILQVGMLLDEDVAVWERTWRINVLGNVLGLRTILPRLIDAKRGTAVVVTSVDAAFAEQQLAHYSSSKGALEMAVRTIALDYARTGVNINLVAPGPMRAGLFERHLASADNPEEFLATRTARQPVGRIIGADEVANVVAFMLSAQASGIFASTVTVDGGLTSGFDFRPWASSEA